MKLTKYEHACFTLEKDGQLVVFDPGSFATDFLAPEHVVGVVITHEHNDHFDHDQLAAIVDKNPNAMIIGPQAVTDKVEVFTTKTVAAGDTLDIGPFHLAFFGGKHALIHSSMAPVANVGVMVNELLYYPGDSFTLPAPAVDTLALPAAAPWMKMSEAMDFLTAIRPRFAFPTHDAILSEAGKEMADMLFGNLAKRNSIDYKRLDGTLEI